MGRGTILLLAFFNFLLAIATVAASPGLSFESKTARLLRSSYLLCQETQPFYNLSDYFSTPEVRDDLVFVFYKTEIPVEDTRQASSALIFGFEYAASYAKANELLAVVIYFKNKKAKIYSIRKKVFEELMNNKIKAEKLLDYLKIEVRDVS